MMQQPMQPQQGGGGDIQQQIMQFIMEAIQSGKQPQEILQALQQAGAPPEALQIAQQILQQVGGQQMGGRPQAPQGQPAPQGMTPQPANRPPLPR